MPEFQTVKPQAFSILEEPPAKVVDSANGQVARRTCGRNGNDAWASWDVMYMKRVINHLQIGIEFQEEFGCIQSLPRKGLGYRSKLGTPIIRYTPW